MNIAMFTNGYLPFSGGVPTSISNFKKEAEKRGHSVHIFAPKYSKNKDKNSDITRVLSLKAPSYSNYYLPLSFLPKVKKEFEKLDIDIVHVHHPYLLGKKGIKLAKEKGIPVVFTYHTFYEKYIHYLPFSEDISKQMLRKMTVSFCNKCDMIIAPSEKVKKVLEGRNIKTKIKVIPSGVDTRIYEKKVDKPKLRKELGLKKDTGVLLYAGRITKEKNLVFLIKCLKKILDKKPDTVCFFAGAPAKNSDYKEKLLELIEKNNIDDKIRFTGDLGKKRLSKFYNLADVFLFASKSETQGLVILESMASSTPVVALNIEPIKTFVQNNVNGFTVKENSSDFCDKVVELLEDSERLEKFSRNAYETAKEYTPRKMADKIISEFQRLIKEGDRNPRITRRRSI